MFVMTILMLSSALFASTITWCCARLFMRREMERRLRDFQGEMSRMVVARARSEVAEALAEINASDMLRGATWRAARSGSDFLNEGLTAILGKRRRAENESRD